jgi:hypothetical protein
MSDGLRLRGRPVVGRAGNLPLDLPADFPLPHPLDFDWRFTEPTVTSLWNLAHELVGKEQRITLLGAPSLARRAMETPVWNGPVLSLDSNAMEGADSSGRVEVIHFDIAQAIPTRPDAALVVSDPPWYEEELLSFLWCATALCRVGGCIVMSIPPLDTRPGIADERLRIERAVQTFGLRAMRIISSAVQYETPFFEANAMRAAGSSRPVDWRRGDLALYVRVSPVLGPRPPATIREDWTERIVGHSRVRIRKQTAGSGDPVLHSIVPGDILPTVSRRDPRRAHADVWTSGNRIFCCSGTETLLQILDAFVHNTDITKPLAQHSRQSLFHAERFRAHLAAYQLLNVVKCERREFREHIAIVRAQRKLGPESDSAVARRLAG